MIMPKGSKEVVARAEQVVRKAGNSITVGIVISCCALVVAAVALMVAVRR